MITAKVIGIMHQSTQVFVQYLLSNGKDGQASAPVGATLDDIKTTIRSVVDAANYADSLSSLVGTVVESSAVPPPSVKSSPEFVPDSVAIPAGTSLNLSVNLLNSLNAIAGFQFDIVLPAGFTLSKVTIGKSANAAGKQLSLSGNRVLVSGLNQTTIADGEVAVLTIAVAVGTTVGLYALGLINGTSTDPLGNAIASLYTGSSIKVA